jgi:hypothetical protein
MCRGKIGHDDEAAARDAAKLLHKKFKGQFCAYLCRYCKLWHVGSQVGLQRKFRVAAHA